MRYKLKIINTDKDYDAYTVNSITNWLDHFKIEYKLTEIPVENPKEYEVSEDIFKIYNNFLRLDTGNKLIKCKLFRDMLVLMKFKFPEDYDSEISFSKQVIIDKTVKLIRNE